MSPDAFIWLVSPQPTKVSLHLTIATHAPQLMFTSNHQSDPSGAKHLALRIKQLDPDGMGPMVDAAVGGIKNVSRIFVAPKVPPKPASAWGGG